MNQSTYNSSAKLFILTIFTLFIITNNVSKAQSKKEQINLLILKVDSLNLEISLERTLCNKMIEDLKKTIQIKDQHNKSLIDQINVTRDSINSLKNTIVIQDKDIITLKSFILLQSDSIAALKISNENIQKNENVNYSENNYKLLQMKFIQSNKDVSGYTSWLRSVISKNNEPLGDLTSICQEYVDDAILTHLGYVVSMSEEEFNKKWEDKYDVNYSHFSHLFENGNCGWGPKKIAELKHLGTLNDGEWFQVTIKGGCGDDDYSETIVRVLKIIKESNSYKIDNFLSLKD